jgi:hypothetical protein
MRQAADAERLPIGKTQRHPLPRPLLYTPALPGRPGFGRVAGGSQNARVARIVEPLSGRCGFASPTCCQPITMQSFGTFGQKHGQQTRNRTPHGFQGADYGDPDQYAHDGRVLRFFAGD